ncbi:hypothetical protein HOY80DRAFT_999928 [Tuber brumale]|nr:hypothetical protein HOY80DRAFT_999928 [Tuber brumale]
MLLALEEINPQSPALLQDEEVSRLLRECLDAMPATQQHETRTPSICTDKDDQEAKSLVQSPLQPPDANMDTLPESAQHSPLATFPVHYPNQNSEPPTKGPKANPPALPPPPHTPQCTSPRRQRTP